MRNYLIIIFLIITVGLYITNLQKEIRELKIGKQVALQNTEAYKDSINVKMDSITVLTSKINNLNKDGAKKENALASLHGEYKALQIKYATYVRGIDTVFIKPALCSDSTVLLKVNGKQGIVGYNFNSIVDLLNCNSVDSVRIALDTINTTSELIYQDGLWRVRTVALNEGVILRGLSTIDTKTFERLNEMKKQKHIGLGFIWQSQTLSPALSIELSDYNISVGYPFSMSVVYKIF